MQKIFLPFFLLSLFLHLAWSGFEMGVLFLGLYSAALIAGGAATITGFFFLHSLSSPLLTFQKAYLQNPSFTHYQDLLIAFAKNNRPVAEEMVLGGEKGLNDQQKNQLRLALKENSKVKKEIQYWESVLPLQPTDRDILFNLSQLYTWDEQPKKAEKTLEMAKNIDPNYPY